MQIKKKLTINRRWSKISHLWSHFWTANVKRKRKREGKRKKREEPRKVRISMIFGMEV